MKYFLGFGEYVVYVCMDLTIFLVILKGFSVKVNADEVRLIFVEAP